VIDWGRFWRRFGLIWLIVFDTGGIAWSFYLGKTLPIADAKWAWAWFWFMIGLTVTVVVGEILSVIFTGRTLSNNYKYMAQKYGWKAWVLFTLFFGALAGLALHLAVIW